MNDKKKRVICVGEVMMEMARSGDGRFTLGYGGDTFNTAVYLARSGDLDVAYATALGDDQFSEGIVSLAKAEGIDTDAILRLPGRLPGLYLIETNPAGERTFYYWRSAAPARELLELPDWGRLAESFLSADLLYCSGITLAIYSNIGIGRWFAILEMALQNGKKVAFDGNYRPRLWGGDIARTRTVMSQALKRTNIALPTFDDEAALWGDASPEATVERLKLFGIPEIVVKNGQNSALVYCDGKQDYVAPEQPVTPVDTTGAGDSFNAGYLAARLSGVDPIQAVKAAHHLAGKKIKHRGAIMPRDATTVH